MTRAPAVQGLAAALHWRITPLARGLRQHADAWQALFRNLPVPHPMLDARYVDALLQHFGRGDEHLCVLHDGQAAQAMTILRPRGFGVWTTFLPSQTQVGPHLMRGVDQVAGLCQALPGWIDRIELLCVDPAVTAPPGHGDGAPDCLPHSLTVNIAPLADFEAYWQSRPGRLRERIRTLERKATAEQAALRFTCQRGNDVAAGVARYAALESAGWKAGEGTALTPGGAQEGFYRDLMTSFAADDSAAVYELRFGERLVASRLTLAVRGTMAILKTTYDESFGRYGPGRLHLRHTIENAHSLDRLQRIEFCTNASHDQLAWITGQRQVCHWSVFRSPRAAATYRLLRATRACLRSLRPAGDEAATSVAIYTSHAGLPRPAHQLLAEREPTDIELGADWLANLEATVFAGGDAVRYFVLSQEQAPMAVLPLTVQRGRLGSRARGLSNFYTARLAPAIAPWVSPTELLPLVRAVRQHLAPLTSLTLAPLDPDDRECRTLAAALALDGFVVYPFHCFRNWYAEPPRTWQEYLERRPGAVRSTIARMGRRFDARGGRIEVLTDLADADRALAAYQHVYARSWKVPEPFTGFIPGLVQLCARRGWLRLGVAWLDGEAIAAQIWIVAHGRAAIYKLAYDSAHAKLAPGTVLTAHLMRHVIEQDRVREVDFLIGDDAYKGDWMTASRERWGLAAYNPRTAGGLGAWVLEAVSRVTKPLRQRSQAHPPHAASPARSARAKNA